MSNSCQRIYLDHAATSWPKLPAAVEAAGEFVQQCGATTGRGAYRSAQHAERWLADARRSVAQLINAPNSNSVAFCSSGTHALNAAFHGLLRPGDHVVTTAIEHNSVLRPLSQLVQAKVITLDIAPADVTGWVDPSAIAALVKPHTRMVAIGHASNVTGTMQSLQEIASIAHDAEAIMLVDASQTLGYVPIDMQHLRLDVLAAAGNKGLRALAGTAILAVVPKLQTEIRALMFGGTGNSSEQIDVAPFWPQSVEVGNLNMPGIVSLAVAAQLADTNCSWRALLLRLRDGLSDIAGVRLFTGPKEAMSIPVLSLAVPGWSIHDLANVLDASFGVETRAGLHCAALVHKFIGSDEFEGTLRMSVGHSTSESEIEATLDAVRAILDTNLGN
jgi:cysteine desulfurase / selenocysteine lyase